MPSWVCVSLRRCAGAVFCGCLLLSVGCDKSSEATVDVGTSGAAAVPKMLPDEALPEKGLPDEPLPKQPAYDRDQLLGDADAFASDGDFDKAAAAIQRVLVVNPDDVEALFQFANVQAAAGKLDQAVQLLDSIPSDHPEAGLPALGQSADWCMVLERFEEAERRYAEVLKRVPRAAVAHRQLAFLLNRQGRRHEAAEHIRQLCLLGDVRQDELHALMTVSHAMYNAPDEPRPTDGSRLYTPIGPSAIARKLYSDYKYAEAAEVLRESIVAGDQSPAIVAFYGRILVEAQEEAQFLAWLAAVDDSVKEYSEYWSALGAYLLGKRRHEEAVRALAEALRRDPTDPMNVRRMNQTLLALGKEDEADKWQDHYVALSKIARASNRIGETTQPNPNDYTTIIEGLGDLNRPLEALTWELFEALSKKSPQETLQAIAGRRKPLVASGAAFPGDNENLYGLNLEAFPAPVFDLPKDATLASIPKPEPVTTIKTVPRMRNVAGDRGLAHTYYVATKPQSHAFAIYQSLGGGVAVIDYDLDGRPDLYLAQGAADPPKMVGVASNLLYRTVGEQLIDVTAQSSATETRYSVGVTAGDWNQDGFPDLVIANIGGKTLLINNGDGTFRRTEFDEDDQNKTLPSSIALADVTGDALPDIIAIHDVDDPTMIRRPQVHADGSIDTVSPLAFTAGVDRIMVNDGAGGMAMRNINDSPRAASTGLGVVVADFDGKPGNEIFVGNDVRPNHLWVRGSDGESFTDIAALVGCGHGNGGMPTASMGIAAGDFDGSGTLDLHITNFYNEPASLFINRGGTFEDRCVQYKLYADSASVLGFGSQAIDYDNDTRPDLAVTNGNVEKAPGEPLEQPPQLFVNLGTEFRLTPVKDPSGYWSGVYLGRGMARLDHNRDGRPDLVVTHIGSPTALLINETETDHHWLRVKLVGSASERDAIGSRVDVQSGDTAVSHWVNGGDGYLCKNESTLSIGLGEIDSIDTLTVTWPDGQQQTIKNVPVDSHLLVVEGQRDVFEFAVGED